METLTHMAIADLAGRGVDLASDPADVPAGAALVLDNVELGGAPGATRLRPRGWLRRFGRKGGWVWAVEDVAGGTLSGTYWYSTKLTRSGGEIVWGRKRSITVTTKKVKVYGWASDGATDADSLVIYRSAAGGATLQPIYTVATPGTTTEWIDDGSLTPSGTAFPTEDSLVSPLGNELFNQTAHVDFLLVRWNQSESMRMVEGYIRDAGPGSSGRRLVGYPDTDEAIGQQQAGFSPQPGPYAYGLLGDYTWVATAGAALYMLGYDWATQAGKPSLSVSEQSGPLSPTIGYTWVVQRRSSVSGIRSLPSNPKSVGPGTDKKYSLSFSTPSGDKTYIYRTRDGGRFYQFVAKTSGAGYTDNTPDSSLGVETVPFEVGAAQGFAVVFGHKGVLVVANKQSSPYARSMVRWSNSSLPYNFPNDPLAAPGYEFEIDPEDGDEIVAGYSWGEAAFLFKRGRVYLMLGSPPTSFSWRALEGSRGLGCAAPRTIVDTPAGLFYLSPAGVCHMATAGAAPNLVSGPIAGVFVEPQRLGQEEVHPPELFFRWRNVAAASAGAHFRVQWASDSGFTAIVTDLQTDDPADVGAFSVNGAPVTISGAPALGWQTLAIAVRPTGLTAGSTYFVRYAVNTGAGYGAWTTLATYTHPYTGDSPARINWDQADWAFAVNYPPRQEYWLFLPTGNRNWCDTCWVLSYADLASGGAPVWRKFHLAATAGCVTKLVIGSAEPQTYLLLAGPDGLLYVYPYLADGYDADTRVSIEPREATATRTVPPAGGAELTVASASWPTTQFGLAGNYVVVRASDGRTYTGLIRANTATTLDVLWLEGRAPPAGTLLLAIGGVAMRLESAWLTLGGDDAHVAVARQIALHSGGQAGQVRLELRGADRPARSALLRYRKALSLPVGGNTSMGRRQMDVRGRRHQILISDYHTRQRWELQGLELALEAAGARL